MPCTTCLSASGPIEHGDIIRLKNVRTGKFLERVDWPSELSNGQKKIQRTNDSGKQEVNWLFLSNDQSVWTADKQFRLYDPKSLWKLHSHDKIYKDRKWGEIIDNQEVTFWGGSDANDWWVASIIP